MQARVHHHIVCMCVCVCVLCACSCESFGDGTAGKTMLDGVEDGKQSMMSFCKLRRAC